MASKVLLIPEIDQIGLSSFFSTLETSRLLFGFGRLLWTSNVVHLLQLYGTPIPIPSHLDANILRGSLTDFAY